MTTSESKRIPALLYAMLVPGANWSGNKEFAPFCRWLIQDKRFKDVDADGSGSITVEELEKALKIFFKETGVCWAWDDDDVPDGGTQEAKQEGKYADGDVKKDAGPDAIALAKMAGFGSRPPSTAVAPAAEKKRPMTQNGAASKIQASFRGKKARSTVKQNTGFSASVACFSAPKKESALARLRRKAATVHMGIKQVWREAREKCKLIRHSLKERWVTMEHVVAIVLWLGATHRESHGGTPEGEAMVPSKYKVKAVINCWDRITDLNNFIEALWPPPQGKGPLTMDECAMLVKRLGWLNVLDTCYVDIYYDLNLAVRDHREVAKIMVRLAIVEPGENWEEETFQPEGRAEPIPGLSRFCRGLFSIERASVAQPHGWILIPAYCSANS